MVLAAAPAHAHLGHVILRAERYLKIDASEADTRVVVSLTLGPSEGLRVLEAADRNDDGEVEQAEVDRYLAEWARGLAGELPITIDGERAEARWTDGFLEPAGPVRQASLTVEMVAHVRTTGREHVIAVEDRMVRREIFDRTDIAFRAHDGAELAGCGLDVRDPDRCEEPDVSTAPGGPQPERLVARVRYPRRAAPPPWTAAVIVAVSILSIVITALVARRLRR